MAGDNVWYLNRAYLHLHGIFDLTSIYNPIYPLSVGIIDILIGNRTLAAIIVNGLAIYIIVAGTYTVGSIYYNRFVAWLAVLFISTSTSLFVVARIFQPHILFIAMLMLCALTFINLVRHPSYWTATLLGITLTISLFTRFEGVVYGLLILVAAWSVFRSTKNIFLALRLTTVSVAILASSAIVYILILSHTNSPSSSSSAYAILIMLKTVPFPSVTFSARYTDLISHTLAQWPLWCWLISVIGLIWSSKRFQKANLLFAGLIIYNMAYIFVLAGWVQINYLRQYAPFFCLLLAASIYQLVARWPRLKVLTPLIIMLIVFPGLVTVTKYTTTAPLGFETSQPVLDSEAIDAWLNEKKLQDTPIYTLCRSVLPFSRSNFHLIYRLANNITWNEPDQLLPEIRMKNELFMNCSNRMFWADWESYIDEATHSDTQPKSLETLKKVGQVGDYTFYRVVHVQ